MDDWQGRRFKTRWQHARQPPKWPREGCQTEGCHHQISIKFPSLPGEQAGGAGRIVQPCEERFWVGDNGAVAKEAPEVQCDDQRKLAVAVGVER